MLMRRANGWMMDLSPWGYAAVMATGLAVGSGTGIIMGRAAAGSVRPVDMWLLATIGGGWLVGLLLLRLMAPAVLQGMRQHGQWREERRQQRG